MLEKGSFSFVALLVINPLLILLFQNCSFAPVTQSQVTAASGGSGPRDINSVGMMDKAAPGHKMRAHSLHKNLASCQGNKDLCPGPQNQ
jgi:hypothetical protein